MTGRGGIGGAGTGHQHAGAQSDPQRARHDPGGNDRMTEFHWSAPSLRWPSPRPGTGGRHALRRLVKGTPVNAGWVPAADRITVALHSPRRSENRTAGIHIWHTAGSASGARFPPHDERVGTRRHEHKDTSTKTQRKERYGRSERPAEHDDPLLHHHPRHAPRRGHRHHSPSARHARRGANRPRARSDSRVASRGCRRDATGGVTAGRGPASTPSSVPEPNASGPELAWHHAGERDAPFQTRSVTARPAPLGRPSTSRARGRNTRHGLRRTGSSASGLHRRHPPDGEAGRREPGGPVEPDGGAARACSNRPAPARDLRG